MNTFIRRLRKLKANSFTLVELLVVISIIGVLAGLCIECPSARDYFLFRSERQ